MREAARLNLRWERRLLPSWAQLCPRAPTLYPVAWSPGKGVGIFWALLVHQRPESHLPRTRRSRTEPRERGARWGRWTSGLESARKCARGWGLGGSLRLAGSACPAEGDSLDPEGSDLLAAAPHRSSAWLSRAHLREPLASAGPSPSPVPRHVDLHRDVSSGRQRASTPALRLCVLGERYSPAPKIMSAGDWVGSPAVASGTQ